MQGSKISLSDAEAALICNAEIILTKNSILKKTVALLAGVQEQLTTQALSSFPSSPKISKGENYLGLPYVVLDYPRISESENLFFIRSMFWWGNFFSSTLQLAGSYKENNLQKIAAAHVLLASQNFYICISDDPWQHHFEPSNYRKIAELTTEEFIHILQQQSHTKIAARWPLSEWDSAANRMIESWKILRGLIA